MSSAASTPTTISSILAGCETASRSDGGARAFPCSQYYLRPLAIWLADRLAPTAVRPLHVTVAGAALTLAAAALVAWGLAPTAVAAGLVLAAWLCDRVDGELARRQQTATAWGAWLDANLDELGDVVIHAAIAAALAWKLEASWPWALVSAFIAGKYLFAYGLPPSGSASPRSATADVESRPRELVRWLYHLPGNADVRVHGLALLLACNLLELELIWTAAYYNLRWIARYPLVARRMQGAAP